MKATAAWTLCLSLWYVCAFAQDDSPANWVELKSPLGIVHVGFGHRKSNSAVRAQFTYNPLDGRRAIELQSFTSTPNEFFEPRDIEFAVSGPRPEAIDTVGTFAASKAHADFIQSVLGRCQFRGHSDAEIVLPVELMMDLGVSLDELAASVETGLRHFLKHQSRFGLEFDIRVTLVSAFQTEFQTILNHRLLSMRYVAFDSDMGRNTIPLVIEYIQRLKKERRGDMFTETGVFLELNEALSSIRLPERPTWFASLRGAIADLRETPSLGANFPDPLRLLGLTRQRCEQALDPKSRAS